MKKFIVAIDGLKYSKAATDYAVHLARQANAHLVGVFLDDFTYHSYKIYELVSEEDEDIIERRTELERRDDAFRRMATDYFEEACRAAGLDHTIHHDKNIALKELLHESIYADLLIIDRKETLTHYEEDIPTRFIRDVLSNVQCAVLVVPGKFVAPDKLVMLYDGSPNAVHAVRMFSYTLGPLNELETEVVTVKPAGSGVHVPDNRLMKEFMKRHYPHARYVVLRGHAQPEIIGHLAGIKNNALVVLGAYRRGVVSRWFRPSLADGLMEDLQFPLFIAHNS
jgi:nucleotide-binding universal stress UspA family protein